MKLVVPFLAAMMSVSAISAQAEAPRSAELALAKASIEQSVEVESVVNINSADAETISKMVKGIGIKKANAIVEFRNQHGAFQSLEELTQVKGIGQRTVDKNADVIVLK